MAVQDNIKRKLEHRRQGQALRTLQAAGNRVDFCSNDYLGLARNDTFQTAIAKLIQDRKLSHGSTGSRLLSGNYPFMEETEQKIAGFHQAETALVFNSGFDANLGLMSCMASREEVILYDNLIHASLRDGIRLSRAAGYSFPHNDLEKMEGKLKKYEGRSFVVVESVYSMDGDLAPLREIASLCKRYSANLVVDEAHATGVVGERGEGVVQQLGLQQNCFARIHTFGKALGVHGAAVLGADDLKQYLLNYARSFIYTTALPPAAVAAISTAYDFFPLMHRERAHLNGLIAGFQQAGLPFEKPVSHTPIQVVVTPGNENARSIARHLQAEGMDARPILYPTVPEGKERLRLVLHSFNTPDEVKRLLAGLNTW